MLRLFMSRRRHFQYRKPRFATSTRPLPRSAWEQSVYYWWWEYLRRHEGYRKCCERGGRTRTYADLYRSFGNVHATDFQTWWTTPIEGEERGVWLFAEPRPLLVLRELRTKDEWDANWAADKVLILAVPLSHSKQQLQRRWVAMLKRRHKGRPGHQNDRTSAARYPVYSKFTIPALQTVLMVYDLHKSEPGLKLAEIGQRIRLVKAAMPKKGDQPKDAAAKRNTLNATVGRYLKHAAAIIENVANGEFPKR